MYIEEFADDRRAEIITTLMRLPAAGQPALMRAIVKGDSPDLVVADRSWGLFDGQIIELKKMRPMKIIRIRQKVCLIALGKSLLGFWLSPAVIAIISVPQ